MTSPVINTREDLDAIVGTPAHDEFMAFLVGSLWRLERDDDAKTWVALEDDSVITRFGFTRADFLDAVQPSLPAYTPPVPEPDMSLDAVKSRQHAVIATAFSLAAQDLTAGYPEAERLTWPTQQSEALAWEADNSTPTPYLDSIAVARGIPVTDMRALTVTQVHLFQTASAQLVGTRQKLRDQIDAVTADTPNAVDVVQAVVWPV